MKVRLISHTVPGRRFRLEEGLDENTDNLQDLVAYCARVSNPTNQNNTETADRLISYLVRNKHWSPLEMVSACLEIETTRDIARQILRHRSFSFQEFSQRYADPTIEFEHMFENREARLQDYSNRQNSLETNNEEVHQNWISQQDMVRVAAMKAYKWAIEHNIAKEQARAVLPEGLTKSRLYMNGTLRSWVHYIELRSENGTQKEHMEIAKECAVVLAPIFPIIKNKIN